MAETMSGGRVIIETLKKLGVTDFFSLPGTTTMGLYESLRQAGGMTLHTGLQDTVPMGAADGLARLTGKLTVAHLYSFPGLANAICGAYSAQMDRVPVLVLCTLTDARQSGRGWSSEVPDLVAFAAQFTKLAIEVPRAERLEEFLRRAAQVALTPPCGPVFVGIPSNMFLEEVPAPTGLVAPLRGVASELPADSAAVERIAELIGSDERVVVVAGSDVVGDAVGELERLSLDYALPVYSEPYASRMPIGPDHPFYFRYLLGAAPTYREANVVVALGAKLAKRFSHFPFDWIQPHQRLAHVHADPDELGRGLPTEVTLQASAAAALPALRRALDRRLDGHGRELIEKRRSRIQKAKAEFDQARTSRRSGKDAQQPADAAAALYAIGQGLRPDDVMIDELIGLRPWGPAYLDVRADRYIGSSAGFMGWGVAAATGVAIGMRGKPGKAVMVGGDGCFVMAPQALWTAARENLPVVYIVLNNRGWVCLKAYYDVVRGFTGTPLDEERIGCDFDQPAVDYVAMAKSFGVPGRAVHSAGEIAGAMREALAAQGPFLIDVVTASHIDDIYDLPRP
jgi:benzoylformate decarboxylase